jgi:hypothetical protein
MLTNVSNWKVWNKIERGTEEIKDMEQRGGYEMIMEEDIKESMIRHFLIL